MTTIENLIQQLKKASDDCDKHKEESNTQSQRDYYEGVQWGLLYAIHKLKGFPPTTVLDP